MRPWRGFAELKSCGFRWYLALSSGYSGHHGLQAHRTVKQPRWYNEATIESKHGVDIYGIEMLVHEMVSSCPMKQYNNRVIQKYCMRRKT